MSVVDQALAASYDAVMTSKRNPENQWTQTALYDEMDRQGMIKTIDFGNTLKETLDYRRNPGVAVLSYDLQPLTNTKTQVLTEASFDPAQIGGDITWSFMDEVKNSDENKKVDLIDSLIDNMLTSTDDLFEQILFAANTNGFLGLPTHMYSTGQGSDGGIDSAIEAWWRVPVYSYTDDTDMIAGFANAYSAASKGSGAKLVPTLGVSNSTAYNLFESTQTPQQRWDRSDRTARVGFDKLMYRTAAMLYSPYGTDTVYFMNAQTHQLKVARGFVRKLMPLQMLENGFGYTRKVYTACQFTTKNRSRGAAVTKNS